MNMKFMNRRSSRAVDYGDTLSQSPALPCMYRLALLGPAQVGAMEGGDSPQSAWNV